MSSRFLRVVAVGVSTLMAVSLLRELIPVVYAASNCTGIDCLIDRHIVFGDQPLNNFHDIHTTDNNEGMRFYNAASLTVIPDGAAIQFWGNGSGLPGQAYIDSGAHNAASINFRTAATGGTIANRMTIDSGGLVTITGNLSVSGTKAFTIDHPLDPANMYLNHSSVEAPEQLNIYSGNITTDQNGDATVRLPRYFEAANRDFRYQLTPIGQFAQVMVAKKVQSNEFAIKTDKPNVEVSWQVSGVRNDAHAKAHPFVAEQPKSPGNRGRYLAPEVHGRSQNESVFIPGKPATR